MNALALILAVSLAAPDGGTPDDGGIESRGVYFVNYAVSCRGGVDLDGGLPCLEPLQLGEGWWLSRERMKATGTTIVALQSDLAERAAADAKRPSWATAGLIGFCLGVTVGVVGLVYLGTRK